MHQLYFFSSTNTPVLCSISVISMLVYQRHPHGHGWFLTINLVGRCRQNVRKCLEYTAVVYGHSRHVCHLPSCGIFRPLHAGEREESNSLRIPQLGSKGAMKERSFGAPPTWRSMADCCLEMVPESIIRKIQIFEGNGNWTLLSSSCKIECRLSTSH